ncbi:MAG TPA: glycosyltransferase family 2 protein [Blastocatellia bacterium]|nr:glycosyltransferase family 2 protein [Blastocatellia bacterium]
MSTFAVMEAVFTILAVFLLVQSVVALLAGLRLARYAWRALSAARERYVPKIALIIPCKGVEPDFDENIIAYLAQDYRHYELIFVTETDTDPAYLALKRILADSNRSAWLITAGEAQNRGQKVHNLCAALDALNAVDRKTEVLVFADSDARPDANWLQELVAPLADPRIAATTGFRWYLPLSAKARRNVWSYLLSAWNAGALSLLGERSSFAWGGATAINRDTFDELRIKERWETGAVSDDYVLSHAVHAARSRIKFVPQCLVVSEAQTTWRNLLEFTARQMTITRVYAPRVWGLTAITHTLFNFTFWGGLIALAFGLVSAATLLPLLVGIFVLGLMTGAIRGFLAAQLLPEEVRPQVRRSWWAYLFLHPFVSLLYLHNIVVSARTNRIVWRGIGYEMRSPHETIIWHRPQPAHRLSETQRKPSGAAAKTSSLDS